MPTDPLTLGYAAASWTAPLLAAHLRRRGRGRDPQRAHAASTLARGRFGLEAPPVCFWSEGAAPCPEKGAPKAPFKGPTEARRAFSRRRNHLTTLAAVAGRGGTARSASRSADQRPQCPTHAVRRPQRAYRSASAALRRPRACAPDFQAFLRELREHHYRAGQPLWLLLDKAPCHVAARSVALAAQLNITFLWLPRQCSELNAMDHLWRHLKTDLAANRQRPHIDALAEQAETWVLALSPQQTLRKAGLSCPRPQRDSPPCRTGVDAARPVGLTIPC